MEKNYRYWRCDHCEFYLIRFAEGIIEDYKKGRGWAVNEDRFDVLSGKDPYYTEIAENEVKLIIEKLENK